MRHAHKIIQTCTEQCILQGESKIATNLHSVPKAVLLQKLISAGSKLYFHIVALTYFKTKQINTQNLEKIILWLQISIDWKSSYNIERNVTFTLLLGICKLWCPVVILNSANKDKTLQYGEYTTQQDTNTTSHKMKNK